MFLFFIFFLQGKKPVFIFFASARINRSNETSWVRDRRRKIKLAEQKTAEKN
jgi:hypothetical protein